MIAYQVCNRPLCSDGARYCEFDGEVEVTTSYDRYAQRMFSHWTCPSCSAQRSYRPECGPTADTESSACACGLRHLPELPTTLDEWAAGARALIAEGDARRRAEYAQLRALIDPALVD